VNKNQFEVENSDEARKFNDLAKSKAELEKDDRMGPFQAS
jgi:hypothetical protein